MNDVAQILTGMREASRKDVMERLVPVVYDELRGLARSQLRDEHPDHSLQATALVHEAYLRLLGGNQPPWNDRSDFFRAAAEAMRRILIEHARKRGRIKRGGNRVRVELSSVDLASEQDLDEILALDDAFQRLEEQDSKAADSRSLVSGAAAAAHRVTRDVQAVRGVALNGEGSRRGISGLHIEVRRRDLSLQQRIGRVFSVESRQCPLEPG